MKINNRLIYKTLFTLIGIVILSIGGFMAYLMTPSGFQSRQAEGPKVLTELLEMAQKSQPFNPDPYISSTYRPGDPLYEPVLAIQRDRWDIAKKLLQPLVEQGNADAMYWLAHISGGSIYAGKEIARLFRKSAELGNPYAALRLDVSSEDCSLYLRGYCDPKWGKLGRKLLQERAEKGDKKAEYYLLQYDENSSEEVHKKLEQLVTENAKNHYYQPLMNMIIDYSIQYYLNYFQKENELPLEYKKDINKLSILMAKNNFSPAIGNIFYTSDIKEPNKYMHHYFKIGGNWSTCESHYKKIIYKSRSNVIDAVTCIIIGNIFKKATNSWTSYNIKEAENDWSIQFINEDLEKNGKDSLSKKEMDLIRKRVIKIVKEMTPMIYIDEMNPRP
ncbi:hypothetical protein VR7878_03871 [Vibrio ruber DSM 16370]|uniref:Sel1 repeat protein n=1 Tax=Vibrio ruber (strain DSM 16370 / JCM 11486 / BCRC 17186 / CECT 7878 / LMG 23124 / VR1) TaxID=1123498 RepID=A0A1R4LTP8_VIBR1|nr:sel1 repeat family protein [Vibrio ruber]SJN59971.1 hypothetical protein VR7878_03871 [Vibrio ruber DSM 16370]